MKNKISIVAALSLTLVALTGAVAHADDVGPSGTRQIDTNREVIQGMSDCLTQDKILPGDSILTNIGRGTATTAR